MFLNREALVTHCVRQLGLTGASMPCTEAVLRIITASDFAFEHDGKPSVHLNEYSGEIKFRKSIETRSGPFGLVRKKFWSVVALIDISLVHHTVDIPKRVRQVRINLRGDDQPIQEIAKVFLPFLSELKSDEAAE